MLNTSTSPNGFTYTHFITVQDIRLCKDVGAGYGTWKIKINGRDRKAASNANPGITYVENSEGIFIGDTYRREGDIYVIVDIDESPSQPSLRTLYLYQS